MAHERTYIVKDGLRVGHVDSIGSGETPDYYNVVENGLTVSQIIPRGGRDNPKWYDVTNKCSQTVEQIIPDPSTRRTSAQSSSSSYSRPQTTGSSTSGRTTESYKSRSDTSSAPMTDAQAIFWTIVVAIFLVMAGINWAVTQVQTIGVLASVNFLFQLPMVLFYRYSGYWMVQSIWEAFQATGFASFVMSAVAWVVLLLILPFWKQVLGLGIVGIITLVAWIIIF